MKQTVRDHLDSYSLDTEQLNSLKALAEQRAPVNRHHFPAYSLVIAGAIFAFLLVFFLTPYMLDKNTVRERIATEVVNNHIKRKPLEIETRSIEELRNYFKKLDFVPVGSVIIKQRGLELIGGRYCSLQGVKAAQLRVRKPGSDTVQTLYQTEYKKDIFKDMPILEKGGDPVDMYVKGVKVKIWVEKDLLFALTDIPDE